MEQCGIKQMDAQSSIGVSLPTIWCLFYQKNINIVVDTPGHGKYVVDGFNAVQKPYLATCLRICSTPEKDKIDSNCMRFDAMNKKGDLIFAK